MNTGAVPQEALVLYNNAFDMASKGKCEEAVSEYKRAISAYPHFVEAKNNLGELLAEMEETGAAIKTFEEALKDSRDFRILFNLGIACCKIGRDAEALDFFNEAIEQKPHFPEANYYAGLLLYNKNQYKDSEAKLLNVISVEPQHLKTNYLLSHIYYEWKQYDKVMECLDRIRHIADDKSFMDRYLGFCHYHLGNYKLAAVYLSSALETHPAYERFRNYLNGITYENKLREIGDIDKSIAELETKLMNGSKIKVSEASKLGMMYIFKGENLKAEKMLLGFKEKLTASAS